MTIVWGHNNFRLKAADPAEIGIFDKELSNYKFELRQKYGHLFWIPFIPLGKFWVIKKPDGKLYHCPPDIEARLQEQFPARTSVWAWTGPLLIIAGFLIFNISEKIEENRWQKQAKESYAKAAGVIEEKIKTLRQNDYLLFTVKPGQNGYYDYNKVPVKVLRVNGDTIIAGRISSKYKDAEEGKTITGSGEEAETYNSEEDLAGMEFKNGIKDSFILSKALLQTAVCHDNLNENNFAGVVIKNFTSAGNCMLKDIVHVAGPVLKTMSLSPDKRDGKYYEFKNMGFSVKADSIVTSKKDGTWQLSKERQFFYGDVIAIRCNTMDSAILYSSDMQKRVYKNKIDNTGYNLQFNAVAE